MIKSNFFSAIGQLRSIFFAAALIIVMASCSDFDDENVVEPVPVSYVSIYHASPDAPGLDIIVDDKRINTNAFDYTDRSGYLNFYTGNRNIKFNAANASSALVDTTFSFAENKAYSLFIVDRVSSLEGLVVQDSAAAPAAGKAMVRLVNLSPDAPAVDLNLKGENATTLFTGKSFKEATSYAEVDAKQQSLEVKAGDQVLNVDNVRLVPGRFYTVIVRGFTNPPAGVNNVLSVEII
jgi:hypothetical protein